MFYSRVKKRGSQIALPPFRPSMRAVRVAKISEAVRADPFLLPWEELDEPGFEDAAEFGGAIQAEAALQLVDAIEVVGASLFVGAAAVEVSFPFADVVEIGGALPSADETEVVDAPLALAALFLKSAIAAASRGAIGHWDGRAACLWVALRASDAMRARSAASPMANFSVHFARAWPDLILVLPAVRCVLRVSGDALEQASADDRRLPSHISFGLRLLWPRAAADTKSW